MNDYLDQIVKSHEGGYVATGRTWSDAGDSGQVVGRKGDWDMWVIKIDADGNFVQQICLGGSSGDGGYGIASTSDGGYIVVGDTWSDNGDVSGRIGTRDMWVVKLSGNLDVQWKKNIGKTGSESIAHAVVETRDGGYIVLGQNNKSGSQDIWVIKLKSDKALSPLVINSISPASGENTGPVTISNLAGSGFKASATVKLTRSGYPDIIATNVVVTPPNKITCNLPITSVVSGQWNVVVTNPNGHTNTRYNGFTVMGPAPTLTSVSPSTGLNIGPVSVTLTGTNFAAGTNTVRLTRSGQTAIAATNVIRDSETRIRCTLPVYGKAAGGWNVVLTTGGQTVTKANGFAITNYIPVITKITPNTGPRTKNIAVTITGKNFRPGATVKISKGAVNRNAVGVKRISGAKITATLPVKNLPLGWWRLTVRNTDGTSGVKASGFLVKAKADGQSIAETPTGPVSSPARQVVLHPGVISQETMPRHTGPAPIIAPPPVLA